MRKINPLDFEIAKRTTSRDINRRIALNLIRTHQPISRADLARKMNIGRGAVTILINELITEGLIYEGETGESLRGRKPTYLFVRTDDRFVVAVDVRLSRTYLMLTDFDGRQIALETFNTVLNSEKFVVDLADRIQRLLHNQDATTKCRGVGVAIPGIVNHKSGLIIKAPTLGWENIDFRDALARLLDMEVHIENASKASALAQMWINRKNFAAAHNFAFVSVSDGVGVGIVAGGELVRGQNGVAGEYGHIPLSLSGPLCSCGRQGCWEAFASNIATISRYIDENSSESRHSNGHARIELENFSNSIHDVIEQARNGNKTANRVLQQTAYYLGVGLAMIINSFDPERIYIGGEITLAWDLIGDDVRKSLEERSITRSASETPISLATATEFPRLMGAAALIVAPTFAALKVA